MRNIESKIYDDVSIEEGPNDKNKEQDINRQLKVNKAKTLFNGVNHIIKHKWYNLETE